MNRRKRFRNGEVGILVRVAIEQHYRTFLDMGLPGITAKNISDATGLSRSVVRRNLVDLKRSKQVVCIPGSGATPAYYQGKGQVSKTDLYSGSKYQKAMAEAYRKQQTDTVGDRILQLEGKDGAEKLFNLSQMERRQEELKESIKQLGQVLANLQVQVDRISNAIVIDYGAGDK